MAKLENVYEFSDLLFFAEEEKIANWNEAHKALVENGCTPDWNYHPTFYRHLVTQEDQDYLLKDERIKYELGEYWFESGPSKKDELAYKIINGFMEDEGIFNMVII